MPVPVGPIKLACNSCSWHKAFPQVSDTVLLPSACPRCSSQHLVPEPAGALDKAFSSIVLNINKIFKR